MAVLMGNMKPFKISLATKTQGGGGGHSEAFPSSGQIDLRGEWRRISGFRSFQSGQDNTSERYEVQFYWRAAIEGLDFNDCIFTFEGKDFRVDNAGLVNGERLLYKAEVTGG